MYLFDSDAAKKICQYHLLYELAEALNCSLSDFAVLPQLKFQLKLANDDKAFSKLGSVEAINCARQLVNAASEVEVVAEAANPLLELNRPDIDSGEAILFAALYDANDKGLISGDKRAFIALSKVDGLPLLDALWARFICFEEAVFLILRETDFQQVSEKIRSRPGVDTAISIAFGRVEANPREMVIDAIKSYMCSLVKDTNGKYIPPADKGLPSLEDNHQR